MSHVVKAYIGLGANLGNRLQQLKCGLRHLQLTAGIKVTAVSSVYQSAALPEADSLPQPDYLNAVIELVTSLPCRWLLRRCLQIEAKLGRKRDRRWAPRTLDLDILLYGRQRFTQPGLTVPHPELHKRAFVLYPLQEIAAGLALPRLGTLQCLVQRCDNTGLTIYRSYK